MRAAWFLLFSRTGSRQYTVINRANYFTDKSRPSLKFHYWKSMLLPFHFLLSPVRLLGIIRELCVNCSQRSFRCRYLITFTGERDGESHKKM